jgi:hypothetical protein
MYEEQAHAAKELLITVILIGAGITAGQLVIRRVLQLF